MIDFSLTDEQKALQEMAREFAEKEMKPNAAKYDKGDEFPQEIMEKAFEVGFITCEIPNEYGGGGLSHVDTVIISEELAWGCAGMYTTIMASSLAYTPIILFGTDEQKKKFLIPCTEKLSFASFCLTEREAGSDAGSLKTTAKKVGDEYIINGSKCFITNGGLASLYVVFALTNPGKGARGMSAFIVPRETPGIVIGKEEDKMGHRASNTAELFFEDVKVPAENLLGREGMGFIIAMKTLDHTRAPVGAAGVGVARAALEYAVEYTKTRIQFGKPIALFQNTAFKIAQMAAENKCCSPSSVACCLANGSGDTLHSGICHGQDVWVGCGDEGDYRSLAIVRWLWLHEGLSHGKAHAGCKVTPDLRRDQRDSKVSYFPRGNRAHKKLSFLPLTGNLFF